MDVDVEGDGMLSFDLLVVSFEVRSVATIKIVLWDTCKWTERLSPFAGWGPSNGSPFQSSCHHEVTSVFSSNYVVTILSGSLNRLVVIL